MYRVYLSIGSNSGKRRYNLLKGIKLLRSEAGDVINISSVYETEPWGFTYPVNFYNIAMELRTRLDPDDLIFKLGYIEKLCGRIRNQTAYKARPLDIDILFFESRVIEKENLIIPHPRLHLRKFVLIPLNEIAPAFIHPVLGKTIAEILASCKDHSMVLKTKF
jgi:2-amino-4-hydroxy-6-hydroxymethyldihydropteridine diphosphokinase